MFRNTSFLEMELVVLLIVLQIEIRNVGSDLFSIIRITLKSFQRIRKQSVTCTVNAEDFNYIFPEYSIVERTK